MKTWTASELIELEHIVWPDQNGEIFVCWTRQVDLLRAAVEQFAEEKRAEMNRAA